MENPNIIIKDKLDDDASFMELVQKGIVQRNSESGIVELDLQALKEFSPDFYRKFLYNAQESILNLKKAVREFFGGEPESDIDFSIINFDYENNISEIRTSNINTIIRVSGMVSKTTKVVALVKHKKWECMSCGTLITMSDKKEPKRCSCGIKNFKNIHIELQDIQEIELEEAQDEIEDRQPQRLRVRLIGNLCDKEIVGILQPGNKVEVVGIVENIKLTGKGKEDDELFDYRVLAINVTSLEEKYKVDIISEEDKREILEISAVTPLQKLAKSLSPSIFGHDDVKKALVLQMVSGTDRTRPDGSRARGRTHILLVGDPGVAKSKLGKSLSLRMPKSFYVSGDEATKAGLVAIVDRDNLLNQWCLKAGALSKANDSVLIIDEMDKLGEDDRNALHTPMESGEIVINKADIHTRLKSECSLLGIANPKSGMFSLDAPFTKQIDIPAPLMSRFDLIFVITDKIDKDVDRSVVDAIYDDSQDSDTISIDSFRKYITFAKKIKPTMDKTHKKDLFEFYHSIRQKSVNQGSNLQGMPITPRHLEGIMRLATASAKVRLSKKVEKEDFEIAKELFYNSLIRLGLDEETGIIDISRISQRVPVSKRGKVESLIEVIHNLSDTNNPIDYKTLLEEGEKLNIKKWELNSFIEQLKMEGRICEPTKGNFSLIA